MGPRNMSAQPDSPLPPRHVSGELPLVRHGPAFLIAAIVLIAGAALMTVMSPSELVNDPYRDVLVRMGVGLFGGCLLVFLSGSLYRSLLRVFVLPEGLRFGRIRRRMIRWAHVTVMHYALRSRALEDDVLSVAVAGGGELLDFDVKTERLADMLTLIDRCPNACVLIDITEDAFAPASGMTPQARDAVQEFGWRRASGLRRRGWAYLAGLAVWVAAVVAGYVWMNVGTAGLVIGGIGALPLGGVALGAFRRAGQLEAHFGQGLQKLSPSPTRTVVDEPPPAPDEAEAALPQSTPLPQRSSAARLGLSVAGAVLALIVGGVLLAVLGRWASMPVGMVGLGLLWLGLQTNRYSWVYAGVLMVLASGFAYWLKPE